MTYRELFLKTAAKTATTNEDLIRGALGLCEEAGEVSGIIKKHLFQGHELDRDKLIKELGDVRWYFEAMCVALETTIEEVEEKNMEKLAKRFPNGFTTEDSQARVDIDEELADLNNGTYKAVKYRHDHGLDSYEAIRIQQEGMTNSIAGRMGIIGELLGGLPIYDREGEKIGVTEAIITAEEARKLIVDSSFVPMNFKDKKLEDWEF